VGGVSKSASIMLCAAAIAAALPARAADSTPASDARAVMEDRCAVCHGENGDGQGPAAGSLSPQPRDFHDRKWQKSVSDETLRRAIVLGGSAVGLSASMPANPDLAERPDVVAALVKQIRAWGK
jgi:mono/diheme cytochrome c family protein